jgi:nucleotide-binding universal stress UspA family protein
MLPFRRIVFPVDYSHPCAEIVPYVKDAIHHFGADLTLLHAYVLNNLADSELLAAEHGWPQRVKTFEEDRLKKFAAEMFPDQHVELRVKEGEPGTVIREFVTHEGTDLVMMPTRGQGPIRRFLLGSVTAKVLHDVSAAVWTGVGTVFKARRSYQSILCALDDTEEAESVLNAAASWACSYHAQLFLLHAVPVPPMALEIDYGLYRKDLIDAADIKFRETKARLDINAPHTITSTMMLDAIREEALRRKADLLVVGRGEVQGAIARIWSNLYPIVRESTCPVLSI